MASQFLLQRGILTGLLKFALTTLLLQVNVHLSVYGFTPHHSLLHSSQSQSHSQHRHYRQNSSTTSLSVGAGYSQALKRRNVQIPLLQISEQSQNTTIVPLPASHLPPELSTLHMYGMNLQAGIHKVMVSDLVSKFPGDLSSAAMFQEGGREPPTYGHIVHKPNGDDWIGAIGCAAEIVLATPSDMMKIQPIGENESGAGSSSGSLGDFGNAPGEQESDESSLTVLARGSFRFVVKEVTQTFPYPIAIVDELWDDEPVEDQGKVPIIEIQDELGLGGDFEDDDDDDDDYDDYDMYAAIPSSDLIPRTMAAMKAVADQKLAAKPKTLSPLEQSILEESGVSAEAAVAGNFAQQNEAEEMAATMQVFASCLLDFAPTRMERLYAVAMMAAEFAGLDNEVRTEILSTLDGVGRLRVVLRAVEEKVGMVQAQKLTEEIVGKTDESSRDLQVGEATLPPWVKGIKKGTRIEYFWSEIDGWCAGEVAEDPVMIVDELLVTVLFDDGETHRLPFRADEKVRWRPAGMN